MKMETLVKEFLFECEIREYSKMTVENYKKQLRHFTDFLKEEFEICELEELKPTHVKAFIKHYQLRQCKPSYVNDNLKAVKVLCAYAYKEKLLTESSAFRGLFRVVFVSDAWYRYTLNADGVNSLH